MSGKLRLNGGISGFSEITAPDVAGDQTFTLPAAGGTLSTSTLVYQQGSWTPTTSVGAAEVNSQSYWWRIGNTVTVQSQLSSFNSSSGSPIQVLSLPYGAVQAGLGAVMTNKFNDPPSASYADPNLNGISFYKSSADKNNQWQQLSYGDRLDGNSTVWLSISYLTDDTTFVPINGATIS